MTINWDRIRPRLGVESDAAIAASLGVSRARVHQVRSELGIHVAQKGRGHIWSAAELSLLGTMFDADLATQIGIGVQAVTRKRSQLKIPAFAKSSAVTRGQVGIKLDAKTLAIVDNQRLENETRTECVRRLLTAIEE